MKKLNLILVVLLAAGSVFAAQTKSPVILLQEGLYAEETEGDLEKAISLYEQVLEQYKDVERMAARATYQLGMCYLKKGEKNKAAEYFDEVVSYYPEQTAVVKKAQSQLDKMGISKVKQGNIFEILGGEVSAYIGSKYGEVCAEAGAKKLYSNSHIYLVDNDFVLRSGGMGYVYNYTGKPITERYRLTGTSYPNQKIYSMLGDEMDVEIVPDENQDNFYQIYWNPEKPLQPGEFFNYGWALDSSKQLSTTGAYSKYPLAMKNNLGQYAYETFFLAVPQGTVLSDQSEEYTDKGTVNNWDIYWWKKIVQQDENHVVNLSLQKIPQYTQEMHNEIDANGLIHFISPHNHTNNATEPITTTSFINSDFVNVTGMYYKDGQPVKYTTTHEGNHFRYNITFDKPILPGETIEGTVEGTITGLIKPVAEMPDTYQYYMNHSPSTNVPTLRIETYLLPKGAEVISTSPGMRKTEKDGRTDLSVEKIIPVGGSLLTTFQYRLTGAELASAKPLKLDPAPWIDGEVMRLSINTMSGMEIGTLGYIARLVDINGTQAWSIQGYQIITANNSQQYTQVDAELDSFAPIMGRTKNDEGDFTAEYDVNGIELSSKFAHGMEKTQNIKSEHTVYDNEQVLYLLRRLPLNEGFQTSFKIFSIQTGAIVDCRINVTGKETVTAPAGTFDCYKTVLAIYSGTIKALEHKLWFSADDKRYVVKYDSGAAIMELVETGIQKQEQKQLVTDKQAGLSITLPAEWRLYKNPSPSPYALSWQLLPPQSKAWAVLTSVQRILGFDSARSVAGMDIEVLKGFFKDYTPRENSWVDLTIDGMEAVSYEADYSDKGGPMVEYRTYILGKSQVYWFVFRVEKDKFKEYQAEFDSIIQSFKHTE